MSESLRQSEPTLKERLGAFVGRKYGVVHAWDPVNQPMIRQWCESLDITHSPYLDPDAAADSVHGQIVAPATMLQVWMMPGLRARRPAGSDLADPREIMPILEEAGYIGILGTNCEQEYVRHLRLGERISVTHAVESISDEKKTKFGPGFFITFLQEYYDENNALVGTMRLRILRFRPNSKAEAPAPRPAPPQPGISSDTEFFWGGLKQKKLLIQRCKSCGALQHPPGPACQKCHSLDLDSIEASGRGKLYSFVVVHSPKNAAFDYPHPVGLIALDEGVRIVAPLAHVDPALLAIGMEMEVLFDNVEGENRLPLFQPAARAASDR